jgi:RNA polymerase sigma-70 factor (ECF subfamily)
MAANDLLAPLLAQREALVGYLTRKVGSRDLAEDLLHDAFLKVSEHPGKSPADDEALVPWFYRLLRNAAIDRFRRDATRHRALEAFTRELEHGVSPPPELAGEVCACVARLAETLKPEYADAVRAIDVEGIPVKDFARGHGLTAGNAGVRVFRAREALRKRVIDACGACADHGCLNCTCRSERGNSRPG